MKTGLYTWLFLILGMHWVCSGLMISEFMADNDSGIKDQDGDRSDWIEIHNDGASAVNLAGWHLTDNNSQLTKWTFPSVSIPSDGYLLVFASDKDRRVSGSELHTNFKLEKLGEYLALIQPGGSVVEHAYAPTYPQQVSDISYGLLSGTVTSKILAQGAAGQAGVPLNESDFTTNYENWNSQIGGGFSSGSWRDIETGVGYEANSDYGSWIGTNGDFQSQMRNISYSLFLRVPFQIDDPSSLSGLKLRMRWDDGMVAYVNGVQVASNAAPATLSWNSQATANRNESQNDDWTTFDIDLSSVSLNAGENLLAIQGMNFTLSSSDLLILLEMDALMPPDSYDYLYFTSSSPGSENQPGTVDLPPLVFDVTDSLEVLPAGGAGSLPVTVQASVSPTIFDVQSVKLHYRKMFESESELTMVDDGTQGDLLAGDGIFTALIPTTSMSAGEMMRWRVVATDIQNNSATSPAYLSSEDSDQYYGTIAEDPSIAVSLLPVLH